MRGANGERRGLASGSNGVRGSSGCLVSLHFTPFTPSEGSSVVSFVGVVVVVIAKKLLVGFVKNLPIQGIDESWCGVRRLDAEEGSLPKKTWVQKSRRHRRRVTQSFPYFKIMQTFGGTATLHKQLGAHIGELPYRAR